MGHYFQHPTKHTCSSFVTATRLTTTSGSAERSTTNCRQPSAPHGRDAASVRCCPLLCALPCAASRFRALLCACLPLPALALRSYCALLPAGMHYDPRWDTSAVHCYAPLCVPLRSTKLSCAALCFNALLYAALALLCAALCCSSAALALL